ncbi:MAG: MotA/TolQ/ExbB proton channel family protein [Kiritimatiellia bacterium]|jgi:biopolymer transport protein ExbB|nr:MotA/TolQ/ExbB proton channel family protein [Kiritimatiellia bacterium]
MTILMQGGAVFWLIVLLGVAAVAVFFERMLNLRRAQIDYGDFLKGVCNVLDNGNRDEAMMICDETPGPVAAVVWTAIRHSQGTPEAIREAVDNTGRAEISRLERRLASLAVTCQIAPLLGLFAAILGGIRLLLTLTEQAPVIQSLDLSQSLMQALVAAAAGVLVAATCHVMYALLMVRIERIVLDMEASASEIVAYLTHQDRSPVS